VTEIKLESIILLIQIFIYQSFVKTKKISTENKMPPATHIDISLYETFYGFIDSPADALVLVEACRHKVLTKVKRRLSNNQRNCIRSGSIFVFDESGSGIRRWTVSNSYLSLYFFFSLRKKRIIKIRD